MAVSAEEILHGRPTGVLAKEADRAEQLVDDYLRCHYDGEQSFGIQLDLSCGSVARELVSRYKATGWRGTSYSDGELELRR